MTDNLDELRHIEGFPIGNTQGGDHPDADHLVYTCAVVMRIS